MTVGELTRVRRLGLGLTQLQVAERMGCSKMFVCKIEYGARLNESWLCRLAVALELIPEEMTALAREHE